MTQRIARWCLLVVTVLVVLASVEATAQPQVVRVKGADARLYQAADPASKVIATMPVGATLEVLAESGDWVRVRQASTGVVGYVRKTAVDVVSAGPSGAGVPGAARRPGQPPETAGGQKPGAPLGPAAAKAATRPALPAGHAWTDRGFVAVSAAYLGSAATFSDRFSFPQYAEQATATIAHRLENVTGFDVGGGLRVWRNLAAGLHVTSFSQVDHPVVEGTVPHPLYLREPRQLTGNVAQASRKELSVHLQAAWVVPVGKRVLVTVAGGPSWMQVRQTVVDEIRWADGYPYDRADYTTAVTRDVERSKVGISAGIDVAYYFTRLLGVGAAVRYAGVKVPVDFRGGEQRLAAGGAQVAVGLRVRLAKPTPKPKPMKQPPPKMPAK